MRAENDRDERVVGYASARGAGRARMEPVTPGGHRDTAWGGAMVRHTDGGTTLGREYVAHSAPGRYEHFAHGDAHGDYMRLGYARYSSALVDPHDYSFHRVAGWRVAVPRSVPGFQVRALLSQIFERGPQAAGYVRLGDTLVPARLSPGDRAALAGTGGH